MRNSSLALLFGAGLFAMLIWSIVHDPNQQLRLAIDDYARRGQAMMDDYSKSVERRVERSLEQLFDELDVDNNNVIERSEFHGATVNMIAALREMDRSRPHLPTLSLPQSGFDLLWWFQVIFTVQLLFLVATFWLVHLHALVIGRPSAVDLGGDYINRVPPTVSKEEALRYATPWKRAGLYERFKIVFFVCTGLLVVRFFLVIFFFCVGVFGITMSVFRGRTRYTHPRWFRFWSNWVAFAGTMIMLAMGFSRVVAHGALAPDSERKILVANHVCVLEVVYLFIQAHMPSFLTAVENLEIPLFSSVAKASDAVMVNRDPTASRNLTMDTLRARISQPTAAPMMIFPEGTCNSNGALFRFRRGAFEAAQPIQMVCFKYPFKHFSPTWNGRPAGGNDLFDLLLRLMTQFVNHLEVVILPVYNPTDAEKQDATLYANHVQAMMANVLKVPVSDATFQDYVALAKAAMAARKARTE